MAKSAASRIARLVLRVFIIVLLLVSVVVLCTNTTTATRGDYDYAQQDFGFQDVIAYRYMAATIVLCILYTTLQLAFSIYKVISSSKGNLLFDFYGEKVMSYMLASGAAAGFAVAVECQNQFDTLKIFRRFYDVAYVSISILLLAFLLTVALSVLSSYALHKKECQTNR